LINKELESKIRENGLKSYMQMQFQDMYLYVNQGQAEYNGFLEDSCIFYKWKMQGHKKFLFFD
jgi:hypothetical protein